MNAVRYQVMPPLSADEYQELHDSIKAQGVIEPIHVDEDGVVIDGHHRSKIATELGIPCPVITHDDLDESGKRSLAFTLNLKRRHLSREQRRALIAESLKSDPQLSNREHARRTGASTTTVGTVRGEMEESGDVSKLDTLTDSMGRKQPATRPAQQPRPEPAPPAPGFEPGDLEELNTTTEPPEPAKPRRTPITDDANRIGWEIRKAAEKLAALTEDDRYTTSKEKVTPLVRGHLQYVIEIATNVLDDLTTPEE